MKPQATVSNRFDKKGKLSYMQINGIQYRSIFEHNTTLGISNALHIFLKQGPLFTVIHNML